MKKQLPLCLLTCLWIVSAMAQEAVVTGLQAPAWVDRTGVREPLQAGARLLPGDQVVTGNGARAVLHLPDDSTVKLGEQARFQVVSMEQAQADRPLKAFLQVLAGAFRYTTSKLGKALNQREIDIQVGTATIGIRGTDIWGKSDSGKDLVCLIEGQVEVTRSGEAPVQLQEALSVYTAVQQQAPDPLWKVELPQLQQWAMETELAEGQGVLQAGGAYAAYLFSAKRLPEAERFQKTLQQDGYAAAIYTVQVKGSDWYRVGVPQFASFQDAKNFAMKLEQLYEISGAWVGRL